MRRYITSAICFSLLSFTGCASVYHDILKFPRGQMLEIRTNPPHADIYISTEPTEEGQRLDPMVCSSTPCSLYVGPEYVITLKKKGYQTEHISPTTKRSLAYILIAPAIGAGFYALLTEIVKLPELVGGAITIAVAVGSALYDIKNPHSLVVDALPPLVSLQLLDEKLAREGEKEMAERDAEEEKIRQSALLTNLNSKNKKDTISTRIRFRPVK